MELIIVFGIISICLIIFIFDGDTSEIKKRKYDKERVERNINKVYQCENSKCNRNYVRMYEVLEGLKYGVDEGECKEKTIISKRTELSIVNGGGSVFESKMYCPVCKENLSKIENHEWMDNIENLKYLTESEWLYRRENFDKELKMVNEQLYSLEKKAEQMREIRTFQEYYKLTLEESEIRFKKDRDYVKNQLELISKISPYLSIRYKAEILIDKLEW